MIARQGSIRTAAAAVFLLFAAVLGVTRAEASVPRAGDVERGVRASDTTADRTLALTGATLTALTEVPRPTFPLGATLPLPRLGPSLLPFAADPALAPFSIFTPAAAPRAGRNSRYVTEDELGNVTHLTDQNGQVLERYEYEGYGKFRIFDPNNTPLTASAYGWNRLFQGREYIPMLDVYDFRARTLWPELGRFGQEDPAGTVDSTNLYQALLGSFVDTSDPLGLCPTCAFPFAVAYGDPAAVQIAEYANAGALAGPVVRDATVVSAVAGPPVVAGGLYAPAIMAAAGPAVGRALLASSLTSAILANPTILPRAGEFVRGLVLPGPELAGPAAIPSRAALRLEQSIARGAGGEAENALARVGENILGTKVGKKQGFDLASYVQTAGKKAIVFVDEVKAGLKAASLSSFSALGLGKRGTATLTRNFEKLLESASQIEDPEVARQVQQAIGRRDVVLRLAVRSMNTLSDGLLPKLKKLGFSKIVIEEIGKPATSLRK